MLIYGSENRQTHIKIVERDEKSMQLIYLIFNNKEIEVADTGFIYESRQLLQSLD